MASGENLIKLFQAYKECNQVDFTKIAYDIIEDEKKKNHNLLATKLYRILFEDNFYVNTNKVSSYRGNAKKLPTDKESGFDLLEMRFVGKSLDSIFLEEENKKKINNVLEEFRAKELLRTYKLHPKTRLLFCGPPGCGKTVTAEAIANELQMPLLYVRFDSLISSFLGETSINLRKVFDFAKGGEWILFFDEFDTIGTSRDSIGEHSELKRVVNSFLQLVDNFSKDIIIITATNYESLIDKAVWRRFDEIIYFDVPTDDNIRDMIKLKLRNYPHKKLKVEPLIEELREFSYSDIERVCEDVIKQHILQNGKIIDNQLFQVIIEGEKKRKLLIQAER